MRPLATDAARIVICVSVYVLGTGVSYAETAEPIESDSNEPCIRWSPVYPTRMSTLGLVS